MGTILLDVDGVCADFVGMVRRLVEAEGDQLPEVTTWDFIKALGVNRDHVEERLTTSMVWGRMEPIPGARDAVEVFRRAGHRVVFVTSPWVWCREWAHVRTDWLRRNMNADPIDVVITSAKELVRGDVFIDDKPENVEAWAKVNNRAFGGNLRAFLWDATYNQGPPHLVRISGGWTQDNIQRVLAVLG